MNVDQRRLIEKTLGGVGALLIAAWVFMIGWGLVRLVGGHMTFQRFFSGMFDTSDAALVIWPPFVGGLVLFWIRAYLQAGGDQKSS
ncbi:hypothetical protein HFV04_016705 [Pseudomonas sp. BIGb0427]|uniref:hypothetical protein n=1 Tax=Pseudomonas sp. BIGb0427 TaxID=2724470 RepID=UPI0018A74392|nr:hypothetical protein [Pseudomonas sp. BIGb0427]QPG61168.1 hypothetical protein HFV04_016705 [Pseudomonas sp. BIGb0427]